MQHISTVETNLNAAKINQAAFKKEVHVLSAKKKWISKFFQDAGITCPPNQEIFHIQTNTLKKLKH